MRSELLAERARRLTWLVIALHLVLVVRLFWMQVVHGERYRQDAFSRLQLERVLEPRRGTITCRDGTSLVVSANAYDIHVAPSVVDDTALARLDALLPEVDQRELAERLAQVRAEALAWMEEDLARRFDGVSERRKTWARQSLTKYFLARSYPFIADVASMDVVREIYVEHARYSGLTIAARPVRRYPLGELAAHVVGHVGRVNAREYERLRPKGYRPTDWIGRAGLEASCEEALKGRRGVEVRGRRVVDDGRAEVLYRDEPVSGVELTTTLDPRIQRVAERALDERLAELAVSVPMPAGLVRGGSAVVLDVATGAVVALASSPRFAPERIARDYARLVADPGHPLHCRPLGLPRVPPPGSVFKILTAIAGLETGTLDPHHASHCRGYLHRPGEFRCWATTGHGEVGLTDAIARSCNVFFYEAGERLDPAALAAWGRAFGFGQPTGIELAGEQAGTMPDPDWVQVAHGRTWQRADSRFVAIGQGLLESTPLQVARFMCACATRGFLPKVHLLESTRVQRVRIEVAARTWELVETGMRAVVREPGGTASRYGLQTFDFVGKTGTAETRADRENHAWIAGWAPADEPRYAIAIMLEHAGHGGEIAGPVAREVLAACFPTSDPVEPPR